MAKDETKSNGLLSKVVRFVRHPMVNWSDLDNLNADNEGESQYSKQALKEMIERKRQNDFVRKREFEHLRKLRQAQLAQAQAARPVTAPGALVPSPSSFLQTLHNTNPDERAVTLKKIDEIEAQMAQQWWRGKQAADATTMPMRLPEGGNPLPSSFRVPPPGTAVPMLRDVLPEDSSARGRLANLGSTKPFDLPSRAPAEVMGMQSMHGETDFVPGFAPTVVSAPAEASMVPPSFVRFEHDAGLEEPAFLFANGDVRAAQVELQTLIERRAQDVPGQLPVWLALLDLYRAAGMHSEFDAAGVDFAARFGRSAPQWFAMPQESGGLSTSDGGDATATAAANGFRWQAPAQLTEGNLKALQTTKSRSPAPWTLDWSRLESIDAPAMASLQVLAQQWANEVGPWVFTGADQLLAVAKNLSPSGDNGVDTRWWHMRLALLRMMHMQDDFELAALDYCVTYEVSPPSWVDPVCQFTHDGQQPEALSLELNSQLFAPDTLPPTTLHANTLWRERAPMFALKGVIEGDALPWLASVQEKAQLGEPICIDCARLVRMDFAAAGSVLNWAATMQSLGHVLQFSQLHQLVAVFFNVVGIQEHAQVMPRRD